MIQNYLFDLYGTLVDIRTDEAKPSLWRRLALLYSLQGAGYDGAELKRAYPSAVEREIDALARRYPHMPRAQIEPDILRVFRGLFADKGILATDEMVKDTAVAFRMLSLEHIRLYPGAKETLAALRAQGKGVYLLSNAQASFTLPELAMLGLTPCFDGIVLSSQVGFKKPSSRIFSHLLSIYGLRAEACLMVGNDAAADIRGAAAMGMESRYIHTKQSPDRPGHWPDSCREIESLLELVR